MNPHGDYRFGDFAVDLEAWLLLRSGKAVHLEPTVLKLLVYLIEHRDRLVTKDELMATVWGDTVVSDSALSKAVASTSTGGARLWCPPLPTSGTQMWAAKR